MFNASFGEDQQRSFEHWQLTIVYVCVTACVCVTVCVTVCVCVCVCVCACLFCPLSRKESYRVVPGHRNWQIETAAWIWPSFFHCALETRWLGVRKICGISCKDASIVSTVSFYRNYRPLLQETGWLGSDFISVRLETRWLGQNPWPGFLCAGAQATVPC